MRDSDVFVGSVLVIADGLVEQTKDYKKIIKLPLPIHKLVDKYTTLTFVSLCYLTNDTMNTIQRREIWS